MAPWPQRLKETIDVCHATTLRCEDPFFGDCRPAPAACLAGSGGVGGLQHPAGVRTPRTARARPLQASLGRHGGGRLAARAGGPNRRRSPGRVVDAVRRCHAQRPASAGRQRQPEHCLVSGPPARRAGRRSQQPRQPESDTGHQRQRFARTQRQPGGRRQQQHAHQHQLFAGPERQLGAGSVGPHCRHGGCCPGCGPGQCGRPGLCPPVGAGQRGANLFFTARRRGQRPNSARNAAGLRAQLGADAQPPASGRGLGG